MKPAFDSNVILYSAGADDRKADIADALIMRGGTISVQVLNEIANVLRGKAKLEWPRIDEFIALFAPSFVIISVTREIHDLGRVVAELHQLSVYDAMVVAAALIAECDTLYSEDMHDGLVIDGRLRIVNPFAPGFSITT